MKKLSLVLIVLSFSIMGMAQTKADFFNSGDTEITWLGIDFSHVKLIGEFNQFMDAGNKDESEIRDKYFPGWNKLILAESDKYNIAEMLDREEVTDDIGMIMQLNDSTPAKGLKAYKTPDYSLNDMKKFISVYDLSGKEGIGVLFVAESLSNYDNQAFFHFLAINMRTKEILVHDRLSGKPRGFGLRNYWAGAIYDIIKEIEQDRYDEWKSGK